ncbi:hypothetical protein EMCRGX_G016017 [Ephydatia muelleri]
MNNRHPLTTPSQLSGGMMHPNLPTGLMYSSSMYPHHIGPFGYFYAGGVLQPGMQGSADYNRPGQYPLGPPGQYPSGPPGQYPSGPPGQYPSGPPGQYPLGPPGQYPPGQYPPGQYPPGPPGQYQSGPPVQYSSGPPGQYPSGPPGQYPSGPPVQYPSGPHGQYPSGLPGQYPPGPPVSGSPIKPPPPSEKRRRKPLSIIEPVVAEQPKQPSQGEASTDVKEYRSGKRQEVVEEEVEPHRVMEESHEVKEGSHEVKEGSHEVKEGSHEVKEGSHEVKEGSQGEVGEEPHEPEDEPGQVKKKQEEEEKEGEEEEEEGEEEKGEEEEREEDEEQEGDGEEEQVREEEKVKQDGEESHKLNETYEVKERSQGQMRESHRPEEEEPYKVREEGEEERHAMEEDITSDPNVTSDQSEGGGTVIGGGRDGADGKGGNEEVTQDVLLHRPPDEGVRPLLQDTQHTLPVRRLYSREVLLDLCKKKECWIAPVQLLDKECYLLQEPTNEWRGESEEIGEPQKIIPHRSHVVELKKAEQPWQRQAAFQLELTEEQKETQEVFRKFQSILNKLTLQNFEKLADQTLQLKINTEERLRGVIDKIFTKSLEEGKVTKFISSYAKLCCVLAALAVETINAEGKPETITFRRLLLSQCQQEFEKDKQEDEERETMQKGVETTETEEKRKQRQMEPEAAEMASRHRSLGNIKFIGELYKLQMFPESTLHSYMVQLLLSSPDEQSLEFFAALITATGKELDRGEAKSRINQYLSRVNDIVESGKTSKRIRFVLQDVVELRRTAWEPLDSMQKRLFRYMNSAGRRVRTPMCRWSSGMAPLRCCKWRGYYSMSSQLKGHYLIG